MTKKPDEDVLSIFKADAKRLGLGLREYCRQFGIEYESLGGRDKFYLLTKHKHVDYRTCDVCRMNAQLNGRSTEETDD